MKIILGDNQFFGVNHFDIDKGLATKSMFKSIDKVFSFIDKSMCEGMDGFMINSNALGFQLISKYDFMSTSEIHYSIPYPHKYANIVNEQGMTSLLKYALVNSNLFNNFIHLIKLACTRNLKYLVPIGVDIETPKKLKKGSTIYLQNIMTDLLIGLNRVDIIYEFIKHVLKAGYRPGIITLNPIALQKKLIENSSSFVDLSSVIICFNINKEGFNVFPTLEHVEKFILENNLFKLMGMSIFASGASNINESIEYIKKLNLHYVVFGTSKIENVVKNLKKFKN